MIARAALALVLGAGASAPLPRASEPGSTAVRRLAQQVSFAVTEHRPEAPVAISVRGESPELSRAFSTLLAAELARAKLAPVVLDAPGPVEAEHLARQTGARSLARLGLSLENGAVVARGDLLGTWVNFWSGAVPTRSAAPAAAISASTPADAEALALNAAAPSDSPAGSEQIRLTPFVLAHLSLPPAALAVGDLDGDGRAEIIALTDEEVSVFAPNGRLIARKDHRSQPPSLAPCREPFGAAAVLSAPPRLAYFSARRARGEILVLEKGALRSAGAVDAAPLGALGPLLLESPFQPGENLFGPTVTFGEQKLSSSAFVAAAVHATSQGPGFLFVLPDGTGALYFGSITANAKVADGIGAGSALADLAGDGRLELVASAPQFAPAADELRAYALTSAGLGPLVWRSAELPKGARVLQVAAGDVDGDGADELVIGLWLSDGTGELDLLRRGPR